MNRGCIPVKALVRSAEIAELSRRSREFGLKESLAEPDFEAIFRRKDGVIARLSQGEELLEKGGIELVRGTARFKSPQTVEVGGREISASIFVIAAGSVPDIPAIAGLANLPFWTSNEAIYPDRQPESLIVMGGSAVGAELAQIYARLGTRVTVLEMKDQLLPGQEPEIGETLAQVFVESGITVLTGAEVSGVEAGDSAKTVVFSRQGREERCSADEILVATGRHPDLDGLGLEAAEVEYGPKGVRVDAFLRTSQPHIWACGDAIGDPMLAHFATWEGRTAGFNCMAGPGDRRQMDYRIIPAAVFTDPPAATAGLSEQAARDAGHDAVAGTYPFAETGRAVAMGETRGLVKLVADRDTRELLGAHIIGHGADDLIHEAVVAMGSRLTVDALKEPLAVHIHPTLSEAVTRAADEI